MRCCRTPGRRASPSQAGAWFAENSIGMLPRLPFAAKAMTMHDIIAGRFELQDSADEALAALRQAGFAADALAAFYFTPHGQHDPYPLRTHDESSVGARHACGGAARGGAIGATVGAIAGAATAPIIGPVGVAIGAGVGAYTGSLVGAVSSTDEESDVDEQTGQPSTQQPEVTEREPGVLVA